MFLVKNDIDSARIVIPVVKRLQEIRGFVLEIAFFQIRPGCLSESFRNMIIILQAMFICFGIFDHDAV